MAYENLERAIADSAGRENVQKVDMTDFLRLADARHSLSLETPVRDFSLAVLSQ